MVNARSHFVALATGAAALGACFPERGLDQHLTCDDSGCLCKGGFDDCDKRPETGCETDLMTSGSHCGACMHDCRGGTCMDGKCMPAVLATPKGPSSFVLAKGELYIACCDPIAPVVKLPATGGAFEAAVIPDAFNTCADQIGANATTIFWAGYAMYGMTVTNAILSNPLDSVVAPMKGNQGGGSAPIAATDGYVYYNGGSPQTLTRSPLPSGPPAAVTMLGYPRTMKASSTVAYWADDFALSSMADTETTPTMVLPKADLISALAIDDQNIYFGSDPSGGLAKIPLAGGAMVTVDATARAVGITVDATHVYWADQGSGALKRAPLAGGATEEIARGFTWFVGLSGVPLAADDRAVYWLTGGAIWVWVKPEPK